MNDEVIDSISASCHQLEELCLLINDETVRARSISKLQNLKRLKLTNWDDQRDEEIKNVLMDEDHEMGEKEERTISRVISLGRITLNLSMT